MPVYDYICTDKKHQYTTEYFLPTPGGMECPKGHPMRRNWKSVNVNKENIRAVPRG